MYINGILKTSEKTEANSNLSIIKNMRREATGNSTVLSGNEFLIESSVETTTYCFTSADVGITVVVSGNIYNQSELNNTLSKHHSSKDFSSIAEIIAYGYLTHGKGIIKMIDGEFIIVIADNNSNSLLIARDRVGTAPLYYSQQNNHFIFSSSLKNLVNSGLVKKEIDENAMSQFFQLTYIPAPKTIIKNVEKITPATLIEISNTGALNSYCYWDVDLTVSNTDYNLCKQELHDLLTKSVEKRLALDGRVGAFLSGGFDSTIIVGLISSLSDERIETFTVGFDDKNFTDERPLSQIVADKNHTNHNTILLDWKLAETAINKILCELEEPFADSSLIATYMVCKKTAAATDYALTGDAGDELFAGYNKYLIGYYNQRINKIPKFIRNGIIKPISKLFPYKSGIARRVNKVLSICDMDIYEQRKNLMMLGFKSHEMKELLLNPVCDNLDFIKELYNKFPDAEEQTRTQYVDLKVVIDGCMMPKVRIAAELAGFKTIAPMLDTQVVEFAFSMPSEFKIKGKKRKLILKDTFRTLIPDELFKAPKKGFAVPIRNWLRDNLKDRLYDLSDENFLKEQNLFNSKYIQELIANHLSGKEDRFSELWAYMVFQSWYKSFFTEDNQ